MILLELAREMPDDGAAPAIGGEAVSAVQGWDPVEETAGAEPLDDRTVASGLAISESAVWHRLLVSEQAEDRLH